MEENLNMDMTMMVDLSAVDELVHSQEFADFLLSNTTDFAVAAFILDVLFSKLDELSAE